LTNTNEDKRQILVLFRTKGGLHIILGKDTNNAGSYFRVDNGLSILTHNNVNAEFFDQRETEEP
jgi:hypothetical protein